VPSQRKTGIVAAALAALTALSAGTTLADPGDDQGVVEAIFSRTSNGYVRLLREDGTFRPETYRFGKGEFWGGDFADASIDKMTVDDVAKAIAPALARQSYVATSDPAAAQLFIVINWGTTVAPEHRTMDSAYQSAELGQMRALGGPHPIAGDTSVMEGTIHGLQEGSLDGGGNSWNLGAQPTESARSLAGFNGGGVLQAENQAWAMQGQQNAMMLGYPSFTEAELQRYRYFVVLLAYDNRTISQKKPKLLWEARLSISQHRNLFNRQLGAIAANASAFFGQDSRGLVHKAVPMGSVQIGRMTALEFPTESDAVALSEDGAHVAYVRWDRSGNGVAVVDVDKPAGVFFAKIPGGGTPAQIGWSDSGHVKVTLSSAEALSFDPGKRSWSAPTAEMAAIGRGAIPREGEIQAVVEGKFPHRTVAILDSDKAGRRYLLGVTGAKGTRYYVYDDQDDILVDVGRSSHAP
jgi:hypothetical protein